MSQNYLSRRRFLYNSILSAGGLLLVPNFISCSDKKVIKNPENYSLNNFDSGVASFDPTHDQVIIWTRYNSTKPQTKIYWQISYENSFDTSIRSGEVVTDSSRDFTVAIELQNLASDKKIYYRFFNAEDKNISVVGETITLPISANNLKLAVCSCSNYPAGLFNVYKAMADSNADIIIHLGDYIYEYGQGQYGTNDNTDSLGRAHEPADELLHLDAYRTRYKQYRSDKDLQLIHQKKPFICVWDDHEIANDTYKDGAQNHTSSEGSFEARKADAIKAYSEYLPVRTADANFIYRNFNFGNLINLIMLDTRVIGRDKQLEYKNYIDENGNFNATTFQTDWLNPNRSLLGKTQKDWLVSQVTNSTAHWQVLGQQVLMGKMLIPAEMVLGLGAVASGTSDAMQQFLQTLKELVAIKMRYSKADPTLTSAEISRITTVLPYNLDAWDGYPAEREMLYSSFTGKKIICLAGDTHNAWFNNLVDNNATEIGKEFATPSVSSPGLENYLGIDAANIKGFENALQVLINDLNYVNASDRGYLSLAFTTNNVESKWIFIDTIFDENFSENTDKITSYSI